MTPFRSSVFFSASNVRWGILERHISDTFRHKTTLEKKKKQRNAQAVPLEMTMEALASNSLRTRTPINKTTLKKMCPTRWSSRHGAVVYLRNNYKDVLQSLADISLT